MLKLSIKGLRLIIVVVQVGAVKRKKERQDETQFTTKIDGKTIKLGSHLFHFVEFSFPVPHLMPYYAKTGHLCPLIA
jgi:hypothetical protein